MGEPNNVLNTYMSNPERIRSILEYYQKEKVPEDWKCADAGNFYTVRNRRGRVSFRQRDLFKEITAGERKFFLGIENQYTINLTFPWRLMEMDCFAYGRMIEEIQQENVRRGVPYNSEDDYKYHYRKEDKLEPIITLTLYWGKKRWKEPVSICVPYRRKIWPGWIRI